MKEVEFFCDGNGDIGQIAKTLLFPLDKDDPTSIYYERTLERPIIDWAKIIRQTITPILLFMLSLHLLFKKRTKNLLLIVVVCLSLPIYILSHLKRILICFVRIYQHFAPESIRKKCRFEPSCSQYMILALEKYGTFKGLMMGIDRLKRCKIGNGGYDLP